MRRRRHADAAASLLGDGSSIAADPLPVEMRLVHIFEMRDGEISRELMFTWDGSVAEGAV